MIAVIIAGGSGTRLWPLSTPDYPKHLMKVGEEERSLLQMTYDRVGKTAREIYVVTEKSHAHHVQDQLPQLDSDHCVIEPGRRGTANCTILALAAIAKSNPDPDEPIFILWADHYIRDVQGFRLSIKLAANASKTSKKIVLVGIEPTHPATGFHYIERGEPLSDEDFVYRVDSFRDKPDHKTAEKYLRAGTFVWNSGYFLGSLNTFLQNMEGSAPEMLKHYEQIKQLDDPTDYYLNLGLSNIDDELIKKVPELYVIPATFDWMDLGSYPDLHTASGQDEQGNFIKGDNIELSGVDNSYLYNCDDKPLAVIGVDNIVVVNTKDGILVARKDLAQSIGEVSKRLYSSN